MAKKLSAFGAEFAKQRKAGAKEFSFGGKKYNTKMKGEVAPAKKKSSLPKTAPVPTSRPGGLTVGKPTVGRGPIGGMRASETKMTSGPSKRGGGPKIAMSKANMDKRAMKEPMRDMETLNNFKQKEARRSSDSKY